MQKLGQHFLKNQAALRLIVEALELKSGETVIEIGPGRGALTTPLAEACAAKKCELIVVEKDEKFITQLEQLKIGESKTEPVKIIHGDILEILPQLATQAGAGFKLVGNIPYYITGHLLRIISELEPSQKPERCIFTIQKEVAERIIAQPPRMNRLAASVQFWAEPKILKTLSASDFSPAPKVESAIIQLTTRDTGDNIRKAVTPEKYYAAVRALFAQPRKTVLNNIEQVTREKKNKENVIKILEKEGVKPNLRPQDLTIENIKALAAALGDIL